MQKEKKEACRQPKRTRREQRKETSTTPNSADISSQKWGLQYTWSAYSRIGIALGKLDLTQLLKTVQL
jgi:hypothetical protein